MLGRWSKPSKVQRRVLITITILISSGFSKVQRLPIRSRNTNFSSQKYQSECISNTSTENRIFTVHCLELLLAYCWKFQSYSKTFIFTRVKEKGPSPFIWNSKQNNSEGLLRHIITFIKKCFHSAFTYVLLSTYSQLIQFFRLKRTLFFEWAILKILKEIK